MKLPILFTALTFLSSFAQASDPDSVFRVRPAFSASAHKLLPSYRTLGDYEHAKAGALARCPVANSYAESLLEKIVAANGLSGFASSEYGPRIALSCGSGIGDSFTKLDATIHLSGGDILNAKSEDQLAFIIAHELAHITMGHIELEPARTRSFDDLKTALDDRTKEWEADKIGIVLMKNAGYDPFAAYDSFLSVRKVKDSFFLGFDFSGSSPFAERQKLIQKYLAALKFPPVRQEATPGLLFSQRELAPLRK